MKTQLLLAVLLSFSLVGHAMTDPDWASKLRAQGEIEMAWAVHFAWAETEDSLPAWRALILTEDYPGFIRNAAYLAAYRQVSAADDPAGYRAFLALPVPRNETQSLVLHQLFAHVERADTPVAYRDFIAAYPASVEAITAQQRLYALAFTEAQTLDTVAAYDAFLREHPEAPQREQAIERAVALAAARIAKEYEGLTTAELEAKTRKLFNQGRLDEKNGDGLRAARAYRLLETVPLFQHTAVLTEFLDREERQLWQRQQAEWTATRTQQLHALSEAVRTQTADLSAAIAAQTERLTEAMVAQTNRVEVALGQHTGQLAELQHELHHHRRIMQHSQRLLKRQLALESAQLAVNVADLFIPF